MSTLATWGQHRDRQGTSPSNHSRPREPDTWPRQPSSGLPPETHSQVPLQPPYLQLISYGTCRSLSSPQVPALTCQASSYFHFSTLQGGPARPAPDPPLPPPLLAQRVVDLPMKACIPGPPEAES
ncbi:hypothetical protein P7K49_032854 [Saguinus oedipus]|uniref:Uncharacterized protein n=1 Tax=Saguinus oedipus TaxID=9490 RepID=A0ABQ9TRY8_SAGOE|nr:hypothetical protein P7K49_032854 [Saguinus oedipus]